jgi:methylmalonyl-CoA mutase
MGAPSLAEDFPAATAEQWRALAAAVLARSGAGEGADPVAALSTTRSDGITLLPLYTAAELPGDDLGLPGAAPHVRGATAAGATADGWDVRARYADPDPQRTNAAVLADLERGATSLWLVLGDAGLAVDDLDVALAGVHLDLAPIVLDGGAQTEQAAHALLALSERRGIARADLRGSLGVDPIGARARHGAAADLGLLTALAQRAANMCVATVDGSVYADAGGSDIDELGIAASVGVAYLRALTDGGLSLDDALDAIEFRYAVTADQFASIAKLRAARRIWSRIASMSGAADERRGQRQHAVTSAAMMTRRDPWVNMLRTTIACFAAAVGGAEAITVLPFDTAIGLPDDFARRIARNTQAVLHDESSLGRVVDAAGGSWYVESLTDAVANAAWDRFTELERAGGALAALDDGTIERLIATSRAARDVEIAHRRAPITGVSEFAYPDEQAVLRPPAPAAASGPLPPVRYAHDFEALRDRTDAVEPRPSVYLATIGPPSRHSARVSFATNLFQAAGLHVVAGPPEEYDGSPVACLCGRDSDYTDEAVTALAAAKLLWLAGRAEFDGVDGTVHAGCDALAVLRRTLDALDVPA